jgi:hypothetical protein
MGVTGGYQEIRCCGKKLLPNALGQRRPIPFHLQCSIEIVLILQREIETGGYSDVGWATLRFCPSYKRSLVVVLRQLATHERPVNHKGSAAFHGGEARYSARRRGRRRYRNRLPVLVDDLVLPCA